MIEKIVKAIVLQKYIFEDEHIIKLLSEGGNIISLKAKGLDKNHSKNRSSLVPFNIVEVEYFTSPSKFSHTGRLKRSNLLEETYSNSEQFLSIIDVSRNLILDSTNNSMLTYKVLYEIINSIRDNNFSFQKLLVLLILIHRQNGYQIMVRACIICGTNKDIQGFSVYYGGLMCKRHEETKRYILPSDTLRKIIEIHLLSNPLVCKELDFSSREIKILKSMYKNFFENQLGINLYSIDKI